MNRRELIALAGGAALAFPFVSRAQQVGRVHRIAWVHPTNPIADMSQNSPVRGYRAFLDELRKLGYVEGQNLILERFSAEGRQERYAELAHDVVRLKPDLIFAIGVAMALQFKSATNTIATVTLTGDPIVYGLATNWRIRVAISPVWSSTLDWRFGASVSHFCKKPSLGFPKWAFSLRAGIGTIFKDTETSFGRRHSDLGLRSPAPS